MNIWINKQRLDWPKAIITEDQLRQYADAPAAEFNLWQGDPADGSVRPITGVANVYDGVEFFSTPKSHE